MRWTLSLALRKAQTTEEMRGHQKKEQPDDLCHFNKFE